jgi:serine protease
MLRTVVVAALVACAVAAPLLNANAANKIADRYIVVFRADASDATRAAHMTRLRGVHASLSAVRTEFEIESFRGYTVRAANTTLESILSAPEVDYVEVDQVVRVSQTCTRQLQTPSWGLERIDERKINLDGSFVHDTKGGAGVDTYIVDTGIYLKHNDYAGRVSWGGNFAADGVNDDCNGHGTHVAGTVAGTLYGVAKHAHLVAVKVLACDGSGSYEGVIQGVQYVASSHKKTTRPSVANMSLGGGLSTAVNQAVAAAVSAGVTFVVAGGNENTDACTRSPASEKSAITVGSTAVDENGITPTDDRSSFSNYGSCLDIFAPGSLITSSWIGSPSAVKTISGTSMAAPHVAGAAAVLLSGTPSLTPAQVKTALNNAATTSAVDLNCPTSGPSSTICKASPNRLLYTACA